MLTSQCSIVGKALVMYPYGRNIIERVNERKSEHVLMDKTNKELMQQHIALGRAMAIVRKVRASVV
eukprot:949806-Lingulodinium_polyedra.AAC.1